MVNLNVIYKEGMHNAKYWQPQNFRRIMDLFQSNDDVQAWYFKNTHHDNFILYDISYIGSKFSWISKNLNLFDFMDT